MENNANEKDVAIKNGNNLHEFSIDDLIKSTYKKIAEWHNDEPSTIALKHLCIDLIEDIAGKAFEHVGLTFTPALQMDESTKKLLEEEKKKNLMITSTGLDQMSDEELVNEINKRNLQAQLNNNERNNDIKNNN